MMYVISHYDGERDYEWATADRYAAAKLWDVLNEHAQTFVVDRTRTKIMDSTGTERDGSTGWVLDPVAPKGV